jgi:hypothetical protein
VFVHSSGDGLNLAAPNASIKLLYDARGADGTKLQNQNDPDEVYSSAKPFLSLNGKPAGYLVFVGAADTSHKNLFFRGFHKSTGALQVGRMQPDQLRNANGKMYNRADFTQQFKDEVDLFDVDSLLNSPFSTDELKWLNSKGGYDPTSPPKSNPKGPPSLARKLRRRASSIAAAAATTADATADATAAAATTTTTTTTGGHRRTSSRKGGMAKPASQRNNFNAIFLPAARFAVHQLLWPTIKKNTRI